LDLLGLDANATVDEIKTAYRDLVLIWHPDKHQSNARNLKRAEEMIKRLNAAREVLIDNGEIPSDWASESARTKQEEPKQEEKREEKKKEKPNDTKDGREKRQKVDEPFIQDERSAERDYVKVSVGAVKQVIKFLKMRWGMTYDYFSRGKGLVYVFLPLSIILILSGTCEKVTRQMSVIVADKSKQTTLENQSALETNQEYENNTKATNNMEALLRNVEKNKKGLAELRILTDYGKIKYTANSNETRILEAGTIVEAVNLINEIQADFSMGFKKEGYKKKSEFTPPYRSETMNEVFQKDIKPKIYIAQAQEITPIYAAPSSVSKRYFIAEKYQYLYAVEYSESFVKIKMSNNIWGYSNAKSITLLKEVSLEEIEKYKK